MLQCWHGVTQLVSPFRTSGCFPVAFETVYLQKAFSVVAPSRTTFRKAKGCNPLSVSQTRFIYPEHVKELSGTSIVATPLPAHRTDQLLLLSTAESSVSRNLCAGYAPAWHQGPAYQGALTLTSWTRSAALLASQRWLAARSLLWSTWWTIWRCRVSRQTSYPIARLTPRQIDRQAGPCPESCQKKDAMGVFSRCVG